MKIFSFVLTEKKPDKETLVPEVVTEPLTSSKDEDGAEAVVATKAIRVNYLQHSRRRFWLHVLLTLMIFVVLACAAVGAIMFYKHWNKKIHSGVCGNLYFDASYHDTTDMTADAEHLVSGNSDADRLSYLEERIEVSEVDLYEKLYTPHFDDVRENYVWHDFSRNYTAIIDHQLGHCFVMKLNRTAIAPPRDLIDLLDKLMSGYYMPKAKVIRENYRVVHPPLSDLKPLGSEISSTCAHYDTLWLEKLSSQVVKRSVKTEETVVYAMLSNFPDQDIYKAVLHDEKVNQDAKLD